MIFRLSKTCFLKKRACFCLRIQILRNSMDNHVEDHPKNLTIRFPATASVFSLIIDPESYISGYENVFYKSERIQKSIIKTI